MPIIKKTLFLCLVLLIFSISKTFAEDLKKVGKFKDWQVMTMSEATGKVCFAQSVPIVRAREGALGPPAPAADPQ